MTTEVEELKALVSELTIKNERIEKTSKKRFEKIKKLEENKVYVENELFKIKCINGFLTDNGFTLKYQQGLPMVNHSVAHAIKALQDKGRCIDEPRANGIYAVKLNGERKIVEITHNICWQMKDEEAYDGWNGIHFYDICDFVLLEAK